jgi:hypothetical protein
MKEWQDCALHLQMRTLSTRQRLPIATSKLQFPSVNLQDPANWTHFSFAQFAADQNSLMGLMASSLHTDKELDKISTFVQLVFYFF